MEYRGLLASGAAFSALDMQLFFVVKSSAFLSTSVSNLQDSYLTV
jgi:hypothetical protein